MLVKGVKLIEDDDFTDTYGTLDSDLEEFNEFEDFNDELKDEDLELIDDIVEDIVDVDVVNDLEEDGL